MAERGVASRRKSEELIEKGLVKVNGHVAHIGDSVDPRADLVTVQGKRLQPVREMKYIMLHKPRGYITTMSDEMGRKCVAELVEDVGERVYPVGRLDRDSEGLLFLTNDGEFANRMTHPSWHIGKVYRVTVRPDISEEQLIAMSSGMTIDGVKTAPTTVHVLSKEDGRVVLEIVLHEGRNRQIRKMCEQLGLEVARLKRVSVGSVKLGILPPGKWRELSKAEINALMSAAAAKHRSSSQAQADRKRESASRGQRGQTRAQGQRTQKTGRRGRR
ncbi:MAG: rRNA pseudouridine synthase [Clostridiales bacterium]|nr:rRNA pseudouridine synthase [Clostridiales bacterium]